MSQRCEQGVSCVNGMFRCLMQPCPHRWQTCESDCGAQARVTPFLGQSWGGIATTGLWASLLVLPFWIYTFLLKFEYCWSAHSQLCMTQEPFCLLQVGMDIPLHLGHPKGMQNGVLMFWGCRMGCWCVEELRSIFPGRRPITAIRILRSVTQKVFFHCEIGTWLLTVAETVS